MTRIEFREMKAEEPVLDEVREQYGELQADFDAAGDAAARLAVLRRWNDLRKRLDTWHSLVHLHFSQDTRDETARAARDRCDEMWPKLDELETGMMRRLCASPHRAELERELGTHLFAVWDCRIQTYDRKIERESVKESKLSAEYTELVASARFEIEGETVNLMGLAKFAQDPRRDVRERATRLCWDWFTAHGEELDRIFDELVRLRTGMARKLGFKGGFLDLAYRRMRRIDYGREEVERYRAAVRDEVVPLSVEIRKRQAESLGVDRLRVWDEAIFDPKGNPKPGGGRNWMVARAREMFREMGHGLDGFFELMVESHLLDLDTREGKAGGGFCTSFPVYGVPFIFANFVGTKDDVAVFTHELGHAFQGYRSRDLFPLDYGWPSAEACEIHSMSLEFLTWPWMERFFGDDAERFRRLHLTQRLLFLPYGVAVDHFQHLVYERPDATADERHAMWLEMESTYLPWRDHGGVERLEKGGFWQRQLHIYKYPLYYIDYTLAQVCALQFWTWSERDREEAMGAYVELCDRGGELPFRELVRETGLKTPFDPGVLTESVSRARGVLT